MYSVSLANSKDIYSHSWFLFEIHFRRRALRLDKNSGKKSNESLLGWHKHLVPTRNLLLSRTHEVLQSWRPTWRPICETWRAERSHLADRDKAHLSFLKELVSVLDDLVGPHNEGTVVLFEKTPHDLAAKCIWNSTVVLAPACNDTARKWMPTIRQITLSGNPSYCSGTSSAQPIETSGKCNGRRYVILL